jgi:triphosphatase
MSDREVELKLEFPVASSALMALSLSRLGGIKVATKKLLSTYFDTDAITLWHHHLSLRVRSSKGRFTQTVKAAGGNAAGLFDRAEWESEVSGELPDMDAAAASPVPALLGRERARTLLKPVFVTDIERTTWRFFTSTSEIELAVDVGQVAAPGAVQAIAEVELELKHGARRDLFTLARLLVEQQPLRIAVQSKSERGYLLARGEAMQSVTAAPLKLSKEARAGDAFGTIAHACLRHFRLNEPFLTDTRASEPLHQARVAIRRLRSAMSLFQGIVADGESASHAGWLRGFSSRLGDARNLDVFLAHLSEAGEAGQPELMPNVEAARETAYDAVLQTLGSTDFIVHMLQFVAWIECGAWRGGDDAARPLEKTAKALLRRRWQKVKKAGKGFEGLTSDQRHSLRIKAKKLRYACEFFSGLFDDKAEQKRRKPFLTTLEQLQTFLGELNDIETGDTLVGRLANDVQTSDNEPGSGLSKMREAGEARRKREPELIASAAQEFGRLRKLSKFWA